MEKAKLSTVNLDGLQNNKGEIICFYFRPKNEKSNNTNLRLISVDMFDQEGNAVDVLVGLNHVDQFVVPEKYTLHQNYPNPFNPSTTIQYDIPQTGHLHLAIYNINGQLVRSLVQEKKEAGSHTVTWKGDDDQGQLVSSGVYFYKVVFDNGVWHAYKKMLYVK
jgi:hypothetical protein